MKIHTLSLQTKGINSHANNKSRSFQFKKNNEAFNNKANKNIIKINFQKIKLNEKTQNEDNLSQKIKKKENKKVSTFNYVVPQKVLKFHKKQFNLKKNNTEKNINTYENALITYPLLLHYSQYR